MPQNIQDTIPTSSSNFKTINYPQTENVTIERKQDENQDYEINFEKKEIKDKLQNSINKNEKVLTEIGRIEEMKKQLIMDHEMKTQKYLEEYLKKEKNNMFFKEDLNRYLYKKVLLFRD